MNRGWNYGEFQPSRTQTDANSSFRTNTSQKNRRSLHGNIFLENQIEGHISSMGKDVETRDGDGYGDDGLDDDMMDKISSSPSIEDEDIDFEFVYALHTFFATIEGQANATKGDTMVLLDDSNSYWWLVRVVKDSSIGYLPAEHIETPTERLARLNKHRNIDLTSAMLGDQQDKYRTPLIKAFRKRSTKTVTFADPTFVEPSDVDYSTEDNEEGEKYFGEAILRGQISEETEKLCYGDENISIEPLRVNTDVNEAGLDDLEQDKSPTASGLDNSRINDEMQDGRTVNKSRNGSLKSTDSIFPDDSVETRKITLTPDLLRDDSSPPAVRVSNELREYKRPSQDRQERDSTEKVIDKKERKDKKSGMLSGLFKRKDRKNKSIDEDNEGILEIKQPKESLEIFSVLIKDSDKIDEQSVQSQVMQPQISKSQKQPRFETSPTREVTQSNKSKDSELNTVTANECVPDVSSSASTHSAQSDGSIEAVTKANQHSKTESVTSVPVINPSENFIPETRMEDFTDSKSMKLKQAKSSVEIDDLGSSSETTTDLSTQVDGISGYHLQDNPTNGSRVKTSASIVDSPSQDEPSSPGSISSPEPMIVEDSITKAGEGISTTLATPNFVWSDAHLRSFFEDDTDIKDLLIIVYDNTGVAPAGPEHPIAGNLFKEENKKLAELTTRLDGILEDWLARKSRTLSGR